VNEINAEVMPVYPFLLPSISKKYWTDFDKIWYCVFESEIVRVNQHNPSIMYIIYNSSWFKHLSI